MKLRSMTTLLASASISAMGLTLASPVLAQTPVQTQGASGTVSGEITRGTASRTFSGVTVEVLGTSIRSTTGQDGRYRLPSLASGDYTLVFSFLGEELSRRDVVVGGEDVTLDVLLEGGDIDEVITTGTRGALNNARALEKSRDGLTSIVTADDIGNFADQNIAESLQRLPGLTINRAEGEGQQVAIRGLSGSFVTVTVDGARLGTRDDFSRSVNLDVLSSDLLNGIEVSKTILPDQDADSIAGSVDLKTLSAFDRGDERTFSVRAEVGYQEKSEDFNPKISGDFTRRFETAGGEFGIAGGLSWQNRKQLVDEISHDDGLIVFFEEAPGDFDAFEQDWDDVVEGIEDGDFTLDDLLYLPARVNLRSDPAERTRISGNLNLEYRTNADTLFFVRGTAAYFEDQDVRNRQRIRLDRSRGSEILAFDVTSGSFEDSRSERRIRFTEQEDTLYTVQAGAEWTSGQWRLDVRGDYSENDSQQPSVEPRFRADNFLVNFANLTGSGIDLTGGIEDGRNVDPNDPADYDYRGFTTTRDLDTTDSIGALQFNAESDVTVFDRPGLLRFGFKATERSREYDFSAQRRATDFSGSLADFGQCDTLTGQSFDFLVNPCLDEIEAFGLSERANGSDEFLLDDAILSIANDYDVSETILAGYVMTKFQPSERTEMIIGFRVEDTRWETRSGIAEIFSFDEDISEGFLDALRANGVTDANILASGLGERYVSANGVITGVNDDNAPIATITESEKNYTDFFPHFSFRWEPTEEIIVRASYTEALQRPNYNEGSGRGAYVASEETDLNDDFSGITSIAAAEAVQVFDVDFGDGVALSDPDLDPLKAKQYDASLSWYPNPDTFFQVAAFYKDISDFIFPLRTGNVAAFGFNPDDLIAGRNVQVDGVSVNSFINGDNAEVYGVELSYSQNYTFLPGALSGLFSYANVTFAESEAQDELIDRTFQFPDQADISGNVSIGWENDKFSIRGSANYVGERLRVLNEGRLGSDVPQSDLLEDDRFSIDLNARYQINDQFQIYLDAVNINDAEDRRFFEPGGRTGRVLGVVESYGATYQLGVRARF